MIITLIGSARFERYFKIWDEALSLAGHPVFTLSVYPSDKREGFTDKLVGKEWYTEEEKLQLDAVHKRKIFHSDAVVLINKFAYIGKSTLSEIEAARFYKVPIYPLESWAEGNGIGLSHHQATREQAREHGVVDFGSPINTTTSAYGFKEVAGFSELLGRSGARRSKLVNLVHSLDPALNYKSGTLS